MCLLNLSLSLCFFLAIQQTHSVDSLSLQAAPLTPLVQLCDAMCNLTMQTDPTWAPASAIVIENQDKLNKMGSNYWPFQRA